MATKKLPERKRAGSTGGLLHKSFQPGKDGYAYLYHWVKFSQAPSSGKGSARLLRSETTVAVVSHQPASRALRAKTTVAIVDSNMNQLSSPGLVCLDLKQPRSARSSGQFVAHLLPAGTTRKEAEAWINSKEGKLWAGGDPVALGATAIRMF